MYYKVKVGEIQYCIGGILKMMGDFENDGGFYLVCRTRRI